MKKTQRSGFIVAGIVAVLAIATLSAPAASGAADPAASAAVDADVLKLREAAWRAYFAGDEAALGAMLPPDFIGINMGDGSVHHARRRPG